MKKLCVIFIILTGICTAQSNLRPGIDYFPHIGFFDFVVNAIATPQDGEKSDSLIDLMRAKNWYFQELKALGLTNLVTDGQFHIGQANQLDSFYLNDFGFTWKHKDWGSNQHTFLPSKYMNSFGHDKDYYTIEIGGASATNISPDNNNFGFTEVNGNKSSYWVNRPGEGEPSKLDLTGEDYTDYISGKENYVRAAFVGVHTSPGALFWFRLPSFQFPFAGTKYTMRILLRKNPGEKDSLAFTLKINQNNSSPKYILTESRRELLKPYDPINYPLATFTQSVYEHEITDTTEYGWFESDEFTLAAGNNLDCHIIWHGNVDIFIDKKIIFEQNFADLYVHPTVTMAQIRTELDSAYTTSDFDKIQNFYFDEPFQLTAKARGEIQSEVRSFFGGQNSRVEINGATGGYPKYYLDFDSAYSRTTSNEFRQYLLYNEYPIDKNTTYSTTSLQNRFDLFCDYKHFEDDGIDEFYEHSGLKSAAATARNNQIPLIMTLGVHSEQYIKNQGGAMSIVQGDHSRRAPTRDEILAMGNMALAYGAKGFMYYMIPTRAATPADGEIRWNTYGLFDDSASVFNLVYGTGLTQDPKHNQKPNDRYYAVQEFINSTNKIDSVLLGLNWLETKSWNKTASTTVDWISNLSTRYPHFGSDDPGNKRFVETGYFLEKSPPSGKIEDAKFVYVVNRRCNIQPANSPDNLENGPDTSYRNIIFNLNFPDSPWDYYTVKDLKTDSVYFTTRTGQVTIFLGAGEGTLLKIEPQITSITQNETLGYNTTFYSDLIVSNDATLTITKGTTLKFENHSRLILSNGNLSVQGTENEPVVFDFVTPYWQATINGIANSYGNVVLNHAKIKNAGVGYSSYLTDNDDIQNCEIFNNYWGIVMHWTHSYGTEKAKIVKCNIHDNATWDNEGRGISLANSSPQIYQTIIRKNDFGLYCGTNANPHDTIDEGSYGYNLIDSNDVGIISYNSTPMLGYVDDEQGGILVSGGGNTIMNNVLYNVKAYSSSTVYLERNYWGTNNPALFSLYSDSTSTIYTDYYLDEMPVPESLIQPGLANKTTMKIDAEWMPPGQGNFTAGRQSNLLRMALKQIRKGNMTAARAILLPLLNNPENMLLSCGALELYGKTYSPEEIESYFSVLQTVGNRPVKNDLTAKALFLLSEYQTDRKEAYLTTLISDYKRTEHAARASYLKIIHLLGEGNQTDEIYALKNDMNRLYPLSPYTKEVNYLIVSGNNLMKPSTGVTTETQPYEYKLIGCYPNPFNPETTIRYSLGGESNVEVEIFDINGTRVLHTSETGKQAGIYNYTWNAINYASGVYFVRITAKGINGLYTFTSKLMLLK